MCLYELSDRRRRNAGSQVGPLRGLLRPFSGRLGGLFGRLEAPGPSWSLRAQLGAFWGCSGAVWWHGLSWGPH
eukprot:2955000-Pyramimonas_sp.AAC.1